MTPAETRRIFGCGAVAFIGLEIIVTDEAFELAFVH